MPKCLIQTGYGQLNRQLAGSCGQLTARGARTASRPRVGSVRRDEFYEEERDKRMAGMGSRSGDEDDKSEEEEDRRAGACMLARWWRSVRPIRPDSAHRGGHWRAFVTEPMMTWPLGGRTDDLEERCIRANTLFLEPSWTGIVWETADGHGALVLVPPEQADAWDDANARIEDSTTHETDDGGRRWERFWEWVASKIAQEPSGISTPSRSNPVGRAMGSGPALVEFALEQCAKAASR